MKIATREAFGEILAECGEKNDKIVVLDADLSGSTKTSVFAKRFPDRFFNVGIAEQNLVGIAAGFAATGKIPVCASFAIFASGRAWEQMRNTVCYSGLPVKLIGSHAGILTGEDGASHQSLEDIALMRSIPNIIIIQPADNIETKSAFELVINNPNPVYFRTTRSGVYTVNDPNFKFRLGKNTILSDFGNDTAIFATGSTVGYSMMAAELLNKDGIKVKVINISSIKPLDVENIIQICMTCQKVITVEDHSIIGGIGSAVSEVIADNGITCKLKRLGMTTFGESGTGEDLYEKYGLDSNGIYNSVVNFINK